jgi:phosphatidylglycerol lysyltransferase
VRVIEQASSLRRGATEARKWSWRSPWAVRLVSMAVFVNGLLEVLTVLLGRVPDGDVPPEFLPFGLYYWNRSLSLAFGLALIYLSLNLLRRKRVAWWLAVAGSVAAAVLPPTAGSFLLSALVPATTAALLLVFGREFRVRSEPRSVARGAALALFALAAAVAYGTAGFWLAPSRDFDANFALVDAFLLSLKEYVLFGATSVTPRTPQAAWFLDSLNVASIVAAGFAAFSLFRPLDYRLRTLPRERHAAEEVLKEHAASSLDYFKLWPDKSYFFSGSGSSFVAFGVASGRAISLGDPVGPEEELWDLVAHFVRFCRDNGWTAAFFEASPKLLPAYRKVGLRKIKIGEEAIVELERFASETAGRKGFRYTRRRFAEREGCSFSRHLPPHPKGLLEEVEEVSREWLSLPGRRERGFTLGAFDRRYVNETPLAVVRDAGGCLLAFANEVPSYRGGEATIDMMRHRRDAPNGTMDFLLLELMLALAEEGCRTFDLGLAPLSGVGDHPEAPVEERALGLITGQLNRFFSYKGLSDYKAKFGPRWEDRFLVYDGGAPALIRTGLAIARLTEGTG